MPLYEYRCVDDSSLMTLLRPMSEADSPVDDPEGRDRTWERVQSIFSVDATPVASDTKPSGGCCGGGCGCSGR
jgi:hypothetical protein